MVNLAAVPPLHATQKDGACSFLSSIGNGSSSSRAWPASVKRKDRFVVSKIRPGRLPTWSQRGSIGWSMRSSPPNHPGLPASSAPPASAAMKTSPSPASHRIPDEHLERLFGSRTKPTSTRQKPSNASIPATSNSISYTPLFTGIGGPQRATSSAARSDCCNARLRKSRMPNAIVRPPSLGLAMLGQRTNSEHKGSRMKLPMRWKRKSGRLRQMDRAPPRS
mmetsp:Transcript_124263/g.247659  ORF Transcript_124263/g.247659 Transcript_124263/m.247659 type:complete len:221 (+) Transcript_124263:229-891(+)